MARYPLMRNNILREDLDAVIAHLSQDDPILTNGPKCVAFEEAWSRWLGVRHSVFVNSGASANLLSMAILRLRHPEGGEVIVLKAGRVFEVMSRNDMGEPLMATPAISAGTLFIRGAGHVYAVGATPAPKASAAH